MHVNLVHYSGMSVIQLQSSEHVSQPNGLLKSIILFLVVGLVWFHVQTMHIIIYKMATLHYLGLSSSNSLFLYLRRLLNK